MDPLVLAAIVSFVLIASAIVSAFSKSARALNLGVIIGRGIIGFLEDRYPSFKLDTKERSVDPYLNTWLMPEEERRKRMIRSMIMGASVFLTWFVTLSILLVLFTGDLWMVPALLIALLTIIAALLIAAVLMLRDRT